MARPQFSPSLIYAGVAVARRCATRDVSQDRAIKDLKLGPHPGSSFDYEGAARFASLSLSSWEWDIFGDDDGDVPAFRSTLQKIMLIPGSTLPDAARAGRKTFLDALNPDEQQCFDIAGLRHGISGAVIDWWDQIASEGWARSEVGKLEIGRKGERLTFEREKGLLPTHLMPEWKALEDNRAGYDVLSWRECPNWENPRECFIEVKATMRNNSFYLSRPEWDFAQRHAESWELHFWNLREPSLATFDFNEVEPHIPDDRGTGRWLQVLVPSLGTD